MPFKPALPHEVVWHMPLVMTLDNGSQSSLTSYNLSWQ